ncbi:hypothetical protein KOM00_08805 [Geomonas sp. Red69]|uniref:DUF1330 domain-containing protein n=1 Tax=Geomonas diazotrophica TaxID=2843197 RepID=A0ABX8JIZ9_9BACT|nr:MULTISPECIES: hypothetical protein [Geomonas]MBU5636832.1 hypothetical protein [Geomonas diazotrophica]QWV98360.1 hypothetical protein KP005_03460 [Geomonas nitrogeniifigens]QXE87542.1 hypothetical protein KP003_03820 [Geomonas nitrogeniifigens]
MHLIQILLPLYDNEGNQFTQDEFLKVRDELSERFGGITTYMRSPARGLWKETKETTVQDDIIIYEVMTRELDRAWWRKYRQQLTADFRQALLIVRASEVELL